MTTLQTSIPATTLEHLQKVSDIYDWFDPAVDHIARHVLKVVPGSARRQWEFAMIYLALHLNGKIHPEACGLAMGAGTERLIYAIAPRVKKAVITDLYLPDSQWVGVRTQDPQELVLQKAPWPVEAEKLQALAMDMRELKLADESFDFAWSTGAFEHIGDDEDFARHLREVHRVLKPGGVYAYTTVVNFGNATDRIPHNYYFHPAHLCELLNASPLCPDPVFDCRVRDNQLNRASLERAQDFGFDGANLLLRPVTSLRRGVLTDANLMVLRKAPASEKKPIQIIGFDESKAWLEQSVRSLLKRTWADWQTLGAETKGETLRTQPHQFPSRATVEARFGSFDASVAASAFDVKVFSRRYSYPTEDTLVREWKGCVAGGEPIAWAAKPNWLYSLVITPGKSKAPTPPLAIQCRVRP